MPYYNGVNFFKVNERLSGDYDTNKYEKSGNRAVTNYDSQFYSMNQINNLKDT